MAEVIASYPRTASIAMLLTRFSTSNSGNRICQAPLSFESLSQKQNINPCACSTRNMLVRTSYIRSVDNLQIDRLRQPRRTPQIHPPKDVSALCRLPYPCGFDLFSLLPQYNHPICVFMHVLVALLIG